MFWCDRTDVKLNSTINLISQEICLQLNKVFLYRHTNLLFSFISVDKGHAYLTEPKVILVDPAIEIDKRKKPAPAKKKPEKKPVTPS